VYNSSLNVTFLPRIVLFIEDGNRLLYRDTPGQNVILNSSISLSGLSEISQNFTCLFMHDLGATHKASTTFLNVSYSTFATVGSE
jgi:hypothetical protein